MAEKTGEGAQGATALFLGLVSFLYFSVALHHARISLGSLSHTGITHSTSYLR